MKEGHGDTSQDNISAQLYEADMRAHAEAIQQGGLLMYWYGVPDNLTGVSEISRH